MLKPGDNITDLWGVGKVGDLKALDGTTVAIMSPLNGTGDSYETDRGTLWCEPFGDPKDASSWRITHGYGRTFSAKHALTGLAGWHLKLLELPV